MLNHFTADNKPVVLKCTFTISTPVGMGWTAYLLQKDGEDNNAFVFTDETGEESRQTISGTINNTEATLYIKATNPSPTELNSALLQIAVTLGNQTTVEAILTPEGRNYKNFTIVQDK